MSPLLHCRRLGEEFGLKDIRVKDESQLPTGSFKCRGLSVAVSLGQTNGNTEGGHTVQR